MDRHDFLNSTWGMLGAASIAHILESCSKSAEVPTPTAGFTVDLSSAANSALKTTGGFILTKGIYIICTAQSTYIALSSVCTHQGCIVNYSTANKQFSCPCHGGLYDSSGKVLSGPPPAPLKQYQVAVSGSTMTVS